MNTVFFSALANAAVKTLMRTLYFIFAFGNLCLGSVQASDFPKAWMDNATGYAIGGFDPVGYFVRGRAVQPQTQIEAYLGGVSWRFENTGNRAAFLSHPRTYVPRFGGVDPYLLAKKRAVLGNPALFDIFENRVYLFYSTETLSHWKKHRAAYVVHAMQAWPKAAARLGLDVAEPVDPVAKKVDLGKAVLCEPARWLQAKTPANTGPVLPARP